MKRKQEKRQVKLEKVPLQGASLASEEISDNELASDNQNPDRLIDDLPDPDKYYSNTNDNSDEEEDEDEIETNYKDDNYSSEEMTDSEENTELPVSKRQRLDSDDETNNLANMETLALQFLGV